MFRILFELFILGLVVESTLACNGYSFNLISLKNCGDDSAVLKVDESSKITLDGNCDLIPQGCVESKGFQTAEVKYIIKKNKLPIASGTADICEQMEKADEDVQNIMSIMGLPQKCPVESGKLCPDGQQKANIEKWSKYLSMGKGGPMEVTADITHDTGKSCVVLEFEIVKK